MKKGAKRLAPATAAICSAAMIHSLLGAGLDLSVGCSGGEEGRGQFLTGTANKLLFEPFMEIWDTNAPGYQQVQQALRHIVASQLSPMSVSGAQRAELRTCLGKQACF
jgi:hypothetical protein